MCNQTTKSCTNSLCGIWCVIFPPQHTDTYTYTHQHTLTHINTTTRKASEITDACRGWSHEWTGPAFFFSLEPSSPVAQVYLELDAEQMTLNIDFRVLGLQTCTQAQFRAVPVIKSWALCILGWHSANRWHPQLNTCLYKHGRAQRITESRTLLSGLKLWWPPVPFYEARFISLCVFIWGAPR